MFDDDPFDGLDGQRKSVDYVLDTADRTRLARHLGQRGQSVGNLRDAFADELGRMLPSGRDDIGLFTAELEGASPEQVRTLLNAVRTHFELAETLEDALRQLCEDASRDIVYGGSFFEVEFFAAPRSGTPKAALIHPLVPRSLLYRRGRPIQLVPDFDGSRKWRGMSFVELDEKNVFEVKVEPNIRAALQSVDSTLSTSAYQFLNESRFISSQDPKARAFDADEYFRLESQMVLRGLRPVGWAGRVDKMLDPYRVWRQYKFMRFQFSIRDSILVAIDEMFSRIASELGFSARLRVEGLATMDDIAEAEEALQGGSRPIADLSTFALVKPRPASKS